jgi:hypothetical protein
LASVAAPLPSEEEELASCRQRVEVQAVRPAAVRLEAPEAARTAGQKVEHTAMGHTGCLELISEVVEEHQRTQRAAEQKTPAAEVEPSVLRMAAPMVLAHTCWMEEVHLEEHCMGRPTEEPVEAARGVHRPLAEVERTGWQLSRTVVAAPGMPEEGL